MFFDVFGSKKRQKPLKKHSLGHSEPGAKKHSKSTPRGTFRPGPLGIPVKFNGGRDRNQRLKKFKILKFSSEIETFKRATHQNPIFCGKFWKSSLKSEIENFKRDSDFFSLWALRDQPRKGHEKAPIRPEKARSSRKDFLLVSKCSATRHSVAAPPPGARQVKGGGGWGRGACTRGSHRHRVLLLAPPPFPNPPSPFFQARKRSTKIKFFGPETTRWGGGLPREGVVAENFVPSLESLSSLGFEERNLGCPRNFARMSRTPGVFFFQKVCAKKVRAHFSFPILAAGCSSPSFFSWGGGGGGWQLTAAGVQGFWRPDSRATPLAGLRDGVRQGLFGGV